MEGAGFGRAYRRISAAAPLRHRAVYHYVSDRRAGNGERRAFARGARHARHPRRADDGHRRLPEAAGRSRIRGPRAGRQGVAGGRRGVRPTARRTGHYGSGRNNQYVVGADVARNQDVVPGAGARLLRAAVQRRRTHGGHTADVLSGRALHSRPAVVRTLRLRRFSGDAHALALQIHLRLSVAARSRPLLGRAGQDTGIDASGRHCGAARSQLHPGRLERRLYHLPDYRDHRLFHRTDRSRVDRAGGRRFGAGRRQSRFVVRCRCRGRCDRSFDRQSLWARRQVEIRRERRQRPPRR